MRATLSAKHRTIKVEWAPLTSGDTTPPVSINPTTGKLTTNDSFMSVAAVVVTPTRVTDSSTIATCRLHPGEYTIVSDTDWNGGR